MGGCILGIDGGGTHTTLAIADDEGRILGTEQGGALNYNAIGMERFRQNLKDAMNQVQDRYGTIEAISLGHSALDDEPDEQTARQMMQGVFPIERAYIHSDVFMALMGATLGAPGVAVVSGTGAMAVAMDASGRQRVAGGWGYRMNDAGSGFFLGQQGLTAAAAAFDGVGPKTSLTDAFMEHFTIPEPREAISRIYEEGYLPSDMAAFAPRELEAAPLGDPVGENIVSMALMHLSGYAIHLIEAIDLPDCTVGIFGGVFEHNPWFVSRFTQQVHDRFPHAKVGFPTLPPFGGALVYYFLKQNNLTQQIRDNLTVTYRTLQERNFL